MFDPFSGVIGEFVVVVVVVVRVADKFIVVVGEFVVVGKFAVVVSTVENTIFGGDTFSRRSVITSDSTVFSVEHYVQVCDDNSLVTKRVTDGWLEFSHSINILLFSLQIPRMTDGAVTPELRFIRFCEDI